MIDFEKDILLITGSNGMLGRALLRKFNFPKDHLIGVDFPTDIRNKDEIEKVFNDARPDYVIHAAARVGGVKTNSENLADFYTDNVRINTNVLECCHKFNVKKTISLLSTCVYPDKADYPLTEEQIHNGPPHISNYTYAYTKRMLDIQSRAYRDQFGENFITIIPNNLYGIEDNFNLESSHVIPAMIRKIYEAKNNSNKVSMWGTGLQLREFTYIDDIADIILLFLNNYNEPNPINIGNTQEYELHYLASKIAEYLEYTGQIFWDSNMPSGQFRKPSNNEKFKNFLKSNNQVFNYTSLEDGLKQTCDWFIKSHPNIRW